MKSNDVEEYVYKLYDLKKLIGGNAYRSLLKNGVLKVWRNSSPHNWFIETSKKDGYLWHSEDGKNRKIPNLSLFKEKTSSIEKVVEYFGRDSGMPKLTEYVLRPEILKLAKFLYE